MSQSDLKVLRFSPLSLPDLTRTRPLKIRGEVMFSKLSPRSIEHSAERPLPPSLLARLRRLDAEQLQVVEIVVVAIERGAVHQR